MAHFINAKVVNDLKKLFNNRNVVLEVEGLVDGSIQVSFRNGFNPETRLFKKRTVLGEFASVNKVKDFLKDSFSYKNPHMFLGYKPVVGEYQTFVLFQK